MTSNLNAPLAGIKVVSLAEQFPGPLCTLLLSELGAEVTLVERPGQGDPQREVGPWLFRFAARGKKSVELDLKDHNGWSAAKQLIDQSDVLVEGFRPGVLDRLGFGPDELKMSNPRLVVCSISGYGQNGPYRTASGHNINYEAISGVLSAHLGQATTHLPDAPPWGDVISGCLAALGVVSALRRVDATGEGSHVDIAITDSLVFAMGAAITRALNGAEAWNKHEGAYGLFKCREGYVALGISHEDHFWRNLADVLELNAFRDFNHDQRLARREQIAEVIQAKLQHETADHWVAVLGDTAACSYVNRLEDIPKDIQLSERGVLVEAVDERGVPFVTVRSPFSDARTNRGPVPGLGSSTDEVLAELKKSQA